MTNKNKKHTFNRNDVIDSIIKMRIEKGMTRLSILEFLKNDLGMSQSYAYEMMREASKEFDERAIQNFGEDLKEDIERFERLYEINLLNKNMKESRENLKEISKLKGHYTERVEIKGDISLTAPDIIKIVKVIRDDDNKE